MPNEDNKILKYNHGEKLLKAPFMINADLKYLLEKVHSCQNNLKNSYAEKTFKHAPSGYSLFTNCSFDVAKNKLHCYRGKDCMEKFCKDLREHAMRIVNYEKNEIIPLTDKKIGFMKSKKSATYVKKDLILIMTKSIIK